MTRERLPRLRPEDLDSEQLEFYRGIVEGPRATGTQHFALTDDEGCLHGPFGIMLHAPGTGAALQELGAAIRYRMSLSDRVREIAILQVAVATGCSFEWYAHTRIGAVVGLGETEIAAIRAGHPAMVDRVEQAAVHVVARLLDGAGLEQEHEYEVAVSVLGTVTVIELVTLVGYYRTLAQLMQVFAVGAPGEPESGGAAQWAGESLP